jgi:hypothetical protein
MRARIGQLPQPFPARLGDEDVPLADLLDALLFEFEPWRSRSELLVKQRLQTLCAFADRRNRGV